MTWSVGISAFTIGISLGCPNGTAWLLAQLFVGQKWWPGAKHHQPSSTIIHYGCYPHVLVLISPGPGTEHRAMAAMAPLPRVVLPGKLPGSLPRRWYVAPPEGHSGPQLLGAQINKGTSGHGGAVGGWSLGTNWIIC